MKFGNYLDSHALPVWRSKYINYKVRSQRTLCMQGCYSALNWLSTDIFVWTYKSS